MDTFLKIVGAAVVFGASIIMLGLIFSLPVMWLLNRLLSESFRTLIFGHAHVTVWQAWGLAVLCAALFKSSSSASSK